MQLLDFTLYIMVKTKQIIMLYFDILQWLKHISLGFTLYFDILQWLKHISLGFMLYFDILQWLKYISLGFMLYFDILKWFKTHIIRLSALL